MINVAAVDRLEVGQGSTVQQIVTGPPKVHLFINLKVWGPPAWITLKKICKFLA
jgi:hypothetical protein